MHTVHKCTHTCTKYYDVVIPQITISYATELKEQKNGTTIKNIVPLVPVHPVFDDDLTRYYTT